MLNLDSEIRGKFSDVLGRITDAGVRERAEASLGRIVLYAELAVVGGDPERLQQNLDMELSTLTSLASISISIAKQRVREGIMQAISRALLVALPA